MRADKVGSTKATFEHRGAVGDAGETPLNPPPRLVRTASCPDLTPSSSTEKGLDEPRFGRGAARFGRPRRRRGSRRRGRVAPRMSARGLAAKREAQATAGMFEESSREAGDADKMEDVMSELLAAYAGGDGGITRGGGGETTNVRASSRDYTRFMETGGATGRRSER